MELHDAGAHQGMGRQGVGPVPAAVDDEDVETRAGEEHRGGGAGGAGADDDDVMRWSARSWRVLVTQQRRGGVAVDSAGDVAGHERRRRGARRR